ncbi:MAG: cystathionine gamma-synthase [Cyanobacteria bacterium REEB67]|nr:cystathionine gamma-synthase [Cyanobacteria bacterium REEB67]
MSDANTNQCNNEQCNNDQVLDFATRAIHEAQGPDPTTGALITPIFQTSTFVLEELGKNKGYQYARTHNPTRTALEDCLASLENAKYGVACASGLAAVSVVAGILKAGDHVIVGEDVYGGVYRLFERVFSRYDIRFTYVNTRNIDEVEAAITPATRLVWLETPTNPLLRLADLKAVGDLAKAHNLIYVVDNTFATPYFQRPLEFGANVIVHSTTKYLSGHSDIIGGAVITSDEELYEQIKFTQNATGAVPGPFDCYLALRGLKTLALRMREHERNAIAVAQFLEQHGQVQEVYYPGLTSHPQHDLAKRQMSGFGGMVSFVVKGGLEGARALVNNTRLFQLAESLGGVKSLLCHPSSMTHAPIPRDVQEHCGITEGLIRLSVGIEGASDLIADLEQGLDKAAKAPGSIKAEPKAVALVGAR